MNHTDRILILSQFPFVEQYIHQVLYMSKSETKKIIKYSEIEDDHVPILNDNMGTTDFDDDEKEIQNNDDDDLIMI